MEGLSVRRLPGLAFGGRKVMSYLVAAAAATGAGLVTAELLPPLHPVVDGGATLLVYGITYILIAGRLGVSPLDPGALLRRAKGGGKR